MARVSLFIAAYIVALFECHQLEVLRILLEVLHPLAERCQTAPAFKLFIIDADIAVTRHPAPMKKEVAEIVETLAAERWPLLTLPREFLVQPAAEQIQLPNHEIGGLGFIPRHYRRAIIAEKTPKPCEG